MLLATVGVLGFLVLQPGLGFSYSTGTRVHTLLYMAASIVIGVQAVQLALLTKWLGVVSGIVPEPRWLAQTKPLRTVETGLLFGGALFLLGVLWSLAILYGWGSGGFGALDPVEGMRVVIPAVTLMIVGMQAVAGALFAGSAELCWRTVDRKRNG